MYPYYELKRDIIKNVTIEYGYIDYNCNSHFHKNLELLYITENIYTVTINSNVYHAKPNNIVVVPSFFQHSAKAQDNTYAILLLIPYVLSTDFFDILSKRNIPFILDDEDFNQKEILPYLNAINNLDDSYSSQIIAKGYVNIIFGKLLAHYKTIESTLNKDTEFVYNAVNYIFENCNEPLTLESISEHFFYDKFYFSRTFNKYTGLSLTDYINFERIQTFNRKFEKDMNQNITDLIYSCGFQSLPTFYRVYKKFYGTTPYVYYNIKQAKKHR